MQMYKEEYHSESVVEEEYMFKDEYGYNNGSTMHMMKPPAEQCLPKHSYNNHTHAQAYAGYLDKGGAKMHQGGGGYGGDQGHYGHHKEGMKLQGGYGGDHGHYYGMNHGHGHGHGGDQGHYGHHKEGMNHGYGGHQGHYGNHNAGAYGPHHGNYCPPQKKFSLAWESKSIVD